MPPRTKNPSFIVNENPEAEGLRVSDEEGEIGLGEEEEQTGRGSDSTESEEETEALQPLRMYFHHNQYKKSIKISTRCFIKKAVATIEGVLNSNEKRWFEDHPQFRHFFHMHQDRNHKVMGMWMLLLRTACTEKKREAWFIVNGVPIRYSLREHGIISGLYCHNYPLDWKRMGGLEFVGRHFKPGTTITYEVIEEKLMSMRPCRDRLNMAVLYFLSSVIIGNAKRGQGAPSVEPFFLRAVNDLELCRTFSWGRLSFDDVLVQMTHLFNNFRGVVEKAAWCFPSFVIPLELLAFEVIPDLKTKFREDLTAAASDCPRMCKSKFKQSAMTGFPLSEIYGALGSTTNIQSMLRPYIGERPLLAQIFDDEENIPDVGDYIVENWRKCIIVEQKPVWFEMMFDSDVNGREEEDNAAADDPTIPPVVASDGLEEIKKGLLEVQQGLLKMNKVVEDSFRQMVDMIDGQNTRLRDMEDFVQFQRSTDMGFDVSAPRSRYWDDGGGSSGGGGGGSGGQGKGKEKEGDGGCDGEEKEKEGDGGCDGEEKEKEGDGGSDGQEKEKEGGDDGEEREKEREKRRKKKPSRACTTPYTTQKPPKRTKKN